MSLTTRLLALLVMAALLAGCSGGGDSSGSTASDEGGANKLLIVGIDSADWRLLKPMVDEGRMPNLAAFMQQSAHGRMKTFYPLEKSPLLWASICTGVMPDVHGVDNFVKGSDQEPVTGSAWYAPALWDIAGAADKSTCVVGMWTTYPARPINGVMVSDYLPYGHGRERPLANLVSPDSLSAELIDLRIEPASITTEQLGRFVDPARLAEADEKFPRDMEKLRDILAADLSYLAVSRHLARTGDYDVFFFYQRGPDMISHHFWGYMEPDKGNVRYDPLQLELFGEVVHRYYEWSDEVFAEVLGWFEPTRQVAVLSDHGFYGPRNSGDKGASEHSEWGIFLVRSPLYQQGVEFGHIELIDVMPTFLALMGLPPASDMPGVILAEGLSKHGEKEVAGFEKNRVESYLGLRPAVGPEGEKDEQVNEEIRKQLRSLGYIK